MKNLSLNIELPNTVLGDASRLIPGPLAYAFMRSALKYLVNGPGISVRVLVEVSKALNKYLFNE